MDGVRLVNDVFRTAVGKLQTPCCALVFKRSSASPLVCNAQHRWLWLTSYTLEDANGRPQTERLALPRPKLHDVDWTSQVTRATVCLAPHKPPCHRTSQYTRLAWLRSGPSKAPSNCGKCAASAFDAMSAMRRMVLCRTLHQKS